MNNYINIHEGSQSSRSFLGSESPVALIQPFSTLLLFMFKGSSKATLGLIHPVCLAELLRLKYVLLSNRYGTERGELHTFLPWNSSNTQSRHEIVQDTPADWVMTCPLTTLWKEWLLISWRAYISDTLWFQKYMFIWTFAHERQPLLRRGWRLIIAT